MFERKKKLVRNIGSFEKSSIRKIGRKITVIDWSKSKGNNFWFEKSGVSNNRVFEKLGFHCMFSHKYSQKNNSNKKEKQLTKIPVHVDIRWNILTHWHPVSFEKMVLLSTKWPFLVLFDPISSQSSWKVLSSMNSCLFLLVSGHFLAFWVRACAQFKILR